KLDEIAVVDGHEVPGFSSEPVWKPTRGLIRAAVFGLLRCPPCGVAAATPQSGASHHSPGAPNQSHSGLPDGLLQVLGFRAVDGNCVARARPALLIIAV